MKPQNNTIQPTAKQAEAYNIAFSENVYFTLFGGAIRGGKTRWLLLSVISYLLKYPNSRGVIIRKDFPTLKKNLAPALVDVFNSGISKYITKSNYSDYQFTFFNNSVLMLMSESYDTDKELNRFRGLETNIIGIDEINEIQEATFDKCIERAGTWFAADAPAKILATCNPSNNWVKDKIYDRYISNTLPNSWRYIPSKITDNPFTPKDYIKTLSENLSPIAFKRFVEGDWNVRESQYIDTEKIQLLNPSDFSEKTRDKAFHFFFDGAFTDKVKNDPSGIISATKVDNDLYIKCALSKHISIENLNSYIQSFVAQNNYTRNSIVFIEPYASGLSLKHELQKNSSLNVDFYEFPKSSGITYKQSKFDRAANSGLFSFIKGGRLYLERDYWNKDFISELSHFPTGAHDDLLDCLVMAYCQFFLSNADYAKQVAKYF